MPTYEYECRRCGRRFEKYQSITDEPLKRCGKCRGKVVRLIGAGAGVLFKTIVTFLPDTVPEEDGPTGGGVHFVFDPETFCF